MKKILAFALVIILAFAFCSCGGNAGGAAGSGDLTDQTVAAAPNAGNLEGSLTEETPDAGTSDEGTVDEGTVDEGTSSGDSTSGETVTELIPSGDYYCYDRFSGEVISGNYIRIHSSNSSQVVFDYVTSAGTFTSLTANIDANGFAYMDLTDTLGINITFYSSEIYVDELEGMGAMAYVFK